MNKEGRLSRQRENMTKDRHRGPNGMSGKWAIGVKV